MFNSIALGQADAMVEKPLEPRVKFLAVIAVLVSACATQSDVGFSVDVQVTLQGTRSQAAGGDEHTLEMASIVLESADLELCAPTAWQRAGDMLSPISQAWAHSESDPTHLGVPHVVQLEGQALLGTFRPAPASYCTLALTFGPADDDAEGVEADPGIVGFALGLKVEGQPLVRVADSQTVRLPLTRLVLDGAAKERVFALDVVLDSTSWLTGVDVTTLDSAESKSKILQNVAASAHLQ